MVVSAAVFNNRVLLMSGEQSPFMNRGGLLTQPCGAPVLSTNSWGVTANLYSLESACEEVQYILAKFVSKAKSV